MLWVPVVVIIIAGAAAAFWIEGRINYEGWRFFERQPVEAKEVGRDTDLGVKRAWSFAQGYPDQISGSYTGTLQAGATIRLRFAAERNVSVVVSIVNDAPFSYHDVHCPSTSHPEAIPPYVRVNASETSCEVEVRPPQAIHSRATTLHWSATARTNEPWRLVFESEVS